MDMEWKDDCERCFGPLRWIDSAYVCEQGCTYCPDCADEMQQVCADCSGTLRMRPRRSRSIGR